MDFANQGNRSLGSYDSARQADTAKMQEFQSAKVARDPTMSESILQQTVSVHKALAEIEARAETIVGKLGYPVGSDTSADKAPSRGGALGSIADALDATGPRLQRIMRHIDLISGQI